MVSTKRMVYVLGLLALLITIPAFAADNATQYVGPHSSACVVAGPVAANSSAVLGYTNSFTAGGAVGDAMPQTIDVYLKDTDTTNSINFIMTTFDLDATVGPDSTPNASNIAALNGVSNSEYAVQQLPQTTIPANSRLHYLESYELGGLVSGHTHRVGYMITNQSSTLSITLVACFNTGTTEIQF